MSRKPLSHSEQNALCLRAQQGDKKAAEILCLTNTGMIRQVAHHHDKAGRQIDDLVQEGYAVILAEAIPRWRPGSAAFPTYARHWVRAAIQGVLFEKGSLVRNGAKVASLDRPVHADSPDGGSWVDRVRGAHNTAAEVDRKLRHELIHESAAEALKEWPEQKRHVAETRLFGFETRKTIGARVGLSGERVRQIERQAVWRVARRMGSKRRPDDIVAEIARDRDVRNGKRAA